MRQSRLYTPQPLAVHEVVELEEPACHYLSRVLRLTEGDSVTLFNGDGSNYQGEIWRVQRHAVQVRIVDSEVAGNESPLNITLAQAINRGERMDYALQKATELGVSKIQPLTSRRVEVRLEGKRLARRLAHWQGVVIAACEQSGRATVPEVQAPLSLQQWTAQSTDPVRLVLDPLAETSLSSLADVGDSVTVLIGPEGGFSDNEIGHLKNAGVTPVSLGPRVLRTETAGPAAIAVLQAVAGDL